MGGLLSDDFSPADGMGQGKKWAGHVFSATQVELRNIVQDSCHSTRTLLPPFAAWAIQQANALRPPALPFSQPMDPSDLALHTAQILRVANSDTKPWKQTMDLVIHTLSELPHAADRFELIESLGTLPFGPVQYIDDFTCTSSCVGAAAKVQQAAIPAFAHKTKTKFNYGDTKGACMFVFSEDTLEQEHVGAPSVSSYRLLGILLDRHLDMVAYLEQCIAVGRSSFLQLATSAAASGFSFQVSAALAEERVFSKILFGAVFFVMVDAAEDKLNKLQAGWAKFLLSGAQTTHINGLAAISQCGWQLRLGTLMLEQAIIARARILLLPVDHPAAGLIKLSDSVTANTWSNMIKACMSKPGFSASIPDITDGNTLSMELIEQARQCPNDRRKALQSYRKYTVRPILLQYDQDAFVQSLQNKIIFGLRFLDLQPMLVKDCPYIMDVPITGVLGVWSRQHAIIRCTACWPWRLTSKYCFVASMPSCPLCKARDVSVEHALKDCPMTYSVFADMKDDLQSHSRNDIDFLQFLLTWHALPEVRFTCVSYVGRCVSLCKPGDGINEHPFDEIEEAST